MALLENQMRKLIEKDFSEREKNIVLRESDLRKRFDKDREYRIKLQEYQKELQIRETALMQKEAEVEQKESDLNEREKNIKDQVKKTLLQSIIEERDKLQLQIRISKEELAALQNAEFRIIDWVSHMEKREQKFFDELTADASKIDKYKVVSDGYEFEEYIAKILRANGYKDVQVTKKSGDFGADIIAEKDAIKYVFQCKYYSSQVGIEAIQQVYAAKTFYNAHVSIAVTNSVFTKAAKVLAEELNVVLWDCEKVLELNKNQDAELCQDVKQ